MPADLVIRGAQQDIAIEGEFIAAVGPELPADARKWTRRPSRFFPVSSTRTCTLTNLAARIGKERRPEAAPGGGRRDVVHGHAAELHAVYSDGCGFRQKTHGAGGRFPHGFRVMGRPHPG